jgi:DNA-binding MarR family transcriptional regulator
MDPATATKEFSALFPAVYLRLHTRKDKRPQSLTPQMTGVLRHFAWTGPMTVGEAARHLRRTQSIVSETVQRLIRRGLLERMSDPRDRRRTIVWLSDAGQDQMRREEQVLSDELLAAALARMSVPDRRSLIRGMRALVSAADRASHERGGSP